MIEGKMWVWSSFALRNIGADRTQLLFGPKQQHTATYSTLHLMMFVIRTNTYQKLMGENIPLFSQNYRIYILKKIPLFYRYFMSK